MNLSHSATTSYIVPSMCPRKTGLGRTKALASGKCCCKHRHSILFNLV